MSEVAGRMSVQIGAHFLERHNGGPGRAARRGARRAPGPRGGARRRQRRAGTRRGWPPASRPRSTCSTRTSTACATSTRSRWGGSPRWRPTGARSSGWSAEADLVIGAVLVAGGRAPVVVDRGHGAGDEAGRGGGRHRHRPGRLHRDVARDDPPRPRRSRRHGVLHYAVGNMPGAVPHTSTYALTNVTLPYLAELARLGVAEAVRARPAARARRQHRAGAGREPRRGRGAGPAASRPRIGPGGALVNGKPAGRPRRHRQGDHPGAAARRAHALRQARARGGAVAGGGAPAGAAADRERRDAGGRRDRPADARLHARRR